MDPRVDYDLDTEFTGINTDAFSELTGGSSYASSNHVKLESSANRFDSSGYSSKASPSSGSPGNNGLPELKILRIFLKCRSQFVLCYKLLDQSSFSANPFFL